MNDKVRISAEDRLAIHELLARSAYGYDHPDIVMLTNCFSEDAKLTLRIADGDIIGPFEPRYGIMKLITDSMAEQTDKRRHVISNIFLKESNNNHVTVISNLTLLATEDNHTSVISAGVYHDLVASMDGEWKIVERHLDLDKAY